MGRNAKGPKPKKFYRLDMQHVKEAKVILTNGTEIEMTKNSDLMVSLEPKDMKHVGYALEQDE